MFDSGYQPAVANGGKANFIDAIETMMAAVGWEFVEEHQAYRIWKNPFDVNDAEKDFHVAIGPVNATTSSVRVGAFENWNPATKGLARPCVRSSTAKACGADASLDNGAFYTSGVNYLGGTNFFFPFVSAPDTGEYSWWASVTKNRIILFTRTDSLAVSSIYTGMFESFIPDNPNEVPLVAIRLDQVSAGATNYTVGAWSRHPGREGTTIRENFAVYPTIAGVASDWTKTEGAVGAGTGDLFHGGVPVGSRILCRPLGATATYGHMRGLYYNILDISVAAGVQIGDTITIAGETWMYSGSNGNWVNASA